VTMTGPLIPGSSRRHIQARASKEIPKLGVLKTNPNTCEHGPSRLSDDDDKDSSSSPEDSSQMSEDSSKEWMFHGTVEILHTMDWDRSDVAEDRSMLTESHKEAFTDFGPTIQKIFSDHAPASIDYAVIVSNIYEATDDQHGNEHMMGMPTRCYLATATRVHRKAWEESNSLCDVRRRWNTSDLDKDHWLNSLLAPIQS
jgi:hypothetical protein